MHDEIWASLPVDRPIEVRHVEFVHDALSPLEGKRVLDVGCGDGRLAATLGAAGASVVGIDPSHVALDRARIAHPEIEFTSPADDGALPFADSSFGSLVCLNVLQHVADTQRVLSECRRVLKSKGAVAIVVPHARWLATVARGPRAFERGHDPLEPVLRFYTRRALAATIESFGVDEVKVRASRGELFARAVRG
jgi:ubiquinone/menaquinone biosynthesis C-methylase UbiE